MDIKRLSVVFGSLLLLLNVAFGDPLSYWNEGEVKRSIQEFVKDVTDVRSENYLIPEDRVAVFDLDGTILCEMPVNFQLALGLKNLRERAALQPRLKNRQPFRAAVEDDSAYYTTKKNHSYVFLESFDGMIQRDYRQFIKEFLKNDTMPYWNKKASELFYKPGIQLVNYLRRNGFEVYICSTSEETCIRELISQTLGFSHINIIGNEVVKEVDLESSERARFVMTNAFRTPENRRGHKCIYFNYRTAKNPVFAFGNTMGDYGLLRWVEKSKHRSLCLVMDHDDPDREIEYHYPELLEHAKEKAWKVVSMKRDFKEVF